MKYFTSAIEAALLLSAERDAPTLTFDAGFWAQMVERSRSVMARNATRSMVMSITNH